MTTTIDNTPADYSELDYANDRIEELQTMLAAANMGDVSPEDKEDAKNFIVELKQELATVNAVLSAVKNSRDSIQYENNELKKQCLMQRKEISKLKALQAV